jgi:hypothetical protein
MCSAAGDGTPSRRVAPFGNPRINACVRLPEAYRSLPRPSSAQGTEASTVRPCSLVRPHAPSGAVRACADWGGGALDGSTLPGRPPRVFPSAREGRRQPPPRPRASAARLSPSALVKVQGHNSAPLPSGRLPPTGLRLTPRPASQETLVGIGRLELPTSPLSGARSSRLSYMPAHTRSRARAWREVPWQSNSACERLEEGGGGPIDLGAFGRGAGPRRPTREVGRCSLERR